MIMDVEWMADYEQAWLDFFDGEEFRNVGFIDRAAVKKATSEALEISWYPNLFDRFHEVHIVLPRDEFVVCVGVPEYDERPHIFVKGGWLSDLHLRPYSVFGLVDAVGVSAALAAGRINESQFVSLRNRIDEIATTEPEIAFVSFADSLLLKANYTIGEFDSPVEYSYDPETLLRLLPSIAESYREELGLSVYSVVAQGRNAYRDTALLHRSKLGNHVSLNSLGLPFAQILEIETAARKSIRQKLHDPATLYLDEAYFHSVRFTREFRQLDHPVGRYQVPITRADGKYYCVELVEALQSLEPAEK